MSHLGVRPISRLESELVERAASEEARWTAFEYVLTQPTCGLVVPFPTARTREDPDERVLECGGTYALYFLTSLAELDPHQIVRTEKHWDYRYPSTGATWCGHLEQVRFELWTSQAERELFSQQLEHLRVGLFEVTYPMMPDTATGASLDALVGLVDL